jgi:hypothetical protein
MAVRNAQQAESMAFQTDNVIKAAETLISGFSGFHVPKMRKQYFPPYQSDRLEAQG